MSDELTRYGIKWGDSHIPLHEPMPDGYWTPWHIAQERIAALKEDRDNNIGSLTEQLDYYKKDLDAILGIVDDGSDAFTVELVAKIKAENERLRKVYRAASEILRYEAEGQPDYDQWDHYYDQLRTATKEASDE